MTARIDRDRPPRRLSAGVIDGLRGSGGRLRDRASRLANRVTGNAQDGHLRLVAPSDRGQRGLSALPEASRHGGPS